MNKPESLLHPTQVPSRTKTNAKWTGPCDGCGVGEPDGAQEVEGALEGALEIDGAPEIDGAFEIDGALDSDGTHEGV